MHIQTHVDKVRQVASRTSYFDRRNTISKGGNDAIDENVNDLLVRNAGHHRSIPGLNRAVPMEVWTPPKLAVYLVGVVPSCRNCLTPDHTVRDLHVPTRKEAIPSLRL